MKITLNLSKHCIQTEARLLHDGFVSQYFKSGTDKALLEEKIELIKTILEKCDFGYLRSAYPELCGHGNDHIVLSIDKKKRIDVIINGNNIRLF